MVPEQLCFSRPFQSERRGTRGHYYQCMCDAARISVSRSACFQFQHNNGSSTSSLTSCEAPSSSSHHRNNHNRSASTPMRTSDESESYCPQLMVPLLQGLSLLQNAVRAKRLSHYQPATRSKSHRRVFAAIRSLTSVCI